MSKSQEILERGRQERATFTPEPGSAPTRAYQYWVNKRRNGEYPKNENFCHFWRVILIWAPLAWLMTPVVAVVRRAPVLAVPFVWIGKKIAGSSERTQNILFWSSVSLTGAAILLSLVAGFISDPMAMLFVFGSLIGIALIVALFTFIGGKLSERSRRLRERNAERRRRASEAAWNAFYNGTGPNPYEEAKRELEATMADIKRRDEKFEKFFAPVGKFFTAVGEYCLVIINAVRVNKWKICPLVTVPVDNERNDW